MSAEVGETAARSAASSARHPLKAQDRGASAASKGFRYGASLRIETQLLRIGVRRSGLMR